MPSYHAALLKTSISNTADQTSSSLPKAAIERTLEKASRSFAASQFLVAQNVFEQIQNKLDAIIKISTNWNSYNSPPPDPTSVLKAKPILNALRSKLLQPDKLLASADGGISFVFVSDTDSRAVIESLNSGERFILLYDLSGNSKTIDWPDGSFDQALDLVDLLRNHLRSEGLAATR
jgi:hypothetical protein